MEIKVPCGCGARYSFEVEPVEGRMPYVVNCPQCGAEGTVAANEIIARQTVPARQPVKVSLRTSAQVENAPVSAAPAQQETAVMCHRHTRSVAANQCVVCQKPICLECMEMFGFLCSINCRYQAEQKGIQVPVYQFQKQLVERHWWRTVGQAGAGIAAIMVVLLGLWIWYQVSLSHPRPFYSIPISKTHGAGTRALFLGPDQVLVVSQAAVALHDIKNKKLIWSANFAPGPTAAAPARGRIGGDDLENEWPAPPFHITPDLLWFCLRDHVQGIDRRTGEARQSIPIAGPIVSFVTNEAALTVVSAPQRGQRRVTRIELPSATVATQEFSVPQSQKARVAEDILATATPPTSQVLVQRELAEDPSGMVLDKIRSELIPAGTSLVQFDLRLLEPRVRVESAIKPAGPSHLNAGTRASTSWRAVAEETFNDIKRSRGEGVRAIDESRYQITLARLMAPDADSWSGEVVGPAKFFPQKSVDVLTAGKIVYLFDKQNKKLIESKLSYPINEQFLQGGVGAPCLEGAGTLFFFDQGVLTAFELPGGNVRWRLPSIGIARVELDGSDTLYVNTTSASPEDVQYSEQIKIDDKAVPVLLKVSAKTGKILWKAPEVGLAVEISGKFVYGLDVKMGGLGLANALAAAEGVKVDRTTHFRIYRLDPRSGKTIWEYYRRGAPFEVDFQKSRILLRFEDELQLLKFMSF